MMKTFFRTLYFELSKIISSKVWYITSLIVMIIQPLFGIIEARDIAAIGLDATPETHSQLAEALPPLEYMGFDVVLFGLLPMVIFGGLIGASEFKNHNLRTTLLCQNNRSIVVGAKVVALAIITALVSAITNYLTIAATHIGLAELGLNPFLLSAITWKYIGFSIIYWVLLTMLSFGIGLLFRNALVPLIFLIPQVYNLGKYLAQRWDWGAYLPVAAGNLLIATPTDFLEHNPIKGGIILLLWVGVTLSIAMYFFIHNDVGGKY